MGIVRVTFLAAIPPGAVGATMTSGARRTSSAASSGRRSTLPFAKRASTTTFRPSIPGGSLADLNYGRCAPRSLAAVVKHGLLNHLGRLEKQRVRDCEADGLGRFEVDA